MTRLIGLLILAALFVFYDVRVVFSAVLSANLALVSVGIACGFAVMATKSVRWWVLVRAQGFRFSLLACMRAFYASLFFSLITPGRLGELGRALFLGEADKHRIARLSISVVLDRLWDILFLLCAGLPLLYAFQSDLHADLSRAYLALGTAALVGIGALVLLRQSRGSSAWATLLGRLGIPVQRIAELSSEAKTVFWNRFGLSAALTLVAWALYVVMAWLLAAALGLTLTPLQLILLVVCGTLASLLPITIGGVGTRDGIYVVCFQLFGLAPEKAVSYSMMFLLVNIVFAVTGWLIYTFSKTDTVEARSDE